MDFARLIKTLRTSTGYSQIEFAKELGITSNYLCLIEKGKRNPSSELIAKLANEFNISQDALEFLATGIPLELSKENAKKYKKLQENIAFLLLSKIKAA